MCYLCYAIYSPVSLHWCISHVLPISYPGVLYEFFVNMVVMIVILIILSYIFHSIFLYTNHSVIWHMDGLLDMYILKFKVSTWCNSLKRWLMSFNPDKTEIMLFKNVENSTNFYFDGKLIPFTSNHKHLGITFSEEAKWNKHVANLIKLSLNTYVFCVNWNIN